MAIVELAIAIKAENVDLNQQLMVLAPQKQGSSGVHRLNQLLQPIFNPPVPEQQQYEPEAVGLIDQAIDLVVGVNL